MDIGFICNGMPERRYHDINPKDAADKEILKKYFPNWNYSNTSKPTLPLKQSSL
jgi:hypothetical protein